MYWSIFRLHNHPNLNHQPNVLSSDGTVSLSTASYSRDGKWFAYALSRSVRHFVAETLQCKYLLTGKRFYQRLHPLDRASTDQC